MNSNLVIFKSKVMNCIRDNSEGVNVYEAIEILNEITEEIRVCAEKTTAVQDAICAVRSRVNGSPHMGYF